MTEFALSSTALTALRGSFPSFETHVLEEGSYSRVERIEGTTPRLVRKTYRARPMLLWRTFLLRSRGAREFMNLERLSRAGVDCVSPLAWGETRMFGCSEVSHLVTAWLEGSSSLRDVVRSTVPDTREGRRYRLALVACYGELARKLHRAGFLSTTLMPRNVLVSVESEDPRLWLCDQPATISMPRSIHLSRLAGIDLYDMAFSASRCQDFSRTERYRLVLSYTDNDVEAARRIWCRLDGRSRFRHRLFRQVAQGLLGRLFSGCLRGGIHRR